VSRVDAACFAVAGPVSNNACTLTNVAWSIDANQLQSPLGTSLIRVINDFEAVGYGILDLKPSDVLTLHDAPAVPHAPMVVLGPGTGLGQALLTWDAGSGHYTVHPTEGAHADFAPVGDIQRRLAAAMEAQLGECEVEMVCCGIGIVRIYDLLRSESPGTAAPAGLTPADVTSRALAGTCPVATQAMHLFLSILGAEAANLGLKALARGGVFIAGGIPGRIMPLLTSTRHLQDAFLRPSCRFAGVRATMPLHVVRLADPGLRGALLVTLRSLKG
jgi:glucokinase